MTKTDTDNAAYTDKFIKYDLTKEDVVESRGEVADWAKLSYGQIYDAH